MSIISRLLKKYVFLRQHFGIHNGLNGHLVDGTDLSILLVCVRKPLPCRLCFGILLDLKVHAPGAGF